MNKVSEIEIVYKTKVKAADRVKANTPAIADELFRKYFKDIMEYREAMYVLYLNRTNFAVGIKLLSIGGAAGTVCDPKLIMQGALKVNAQAFILAHNHPSGSLYPSEQDKVLTKKIKDLGDLMDLPLLDHLILTEESYFSFGNAGLI